MAQLLQEILDRKADEVAVYDDYTSYTWAQTNERCNRLIHGLRALGMGTGDVVALIAGNRAEWGEANSAAFNAGFVLVPVNWHLAAPEIAYILNDSGAKVVIADPEFSELVSKAVAEAPNVSGKIVMSGGEIAGFAGYEDVLAESSPDEPNDQVGGSNMFYTSGTTGNPKGVRSTAMPPGGDIAVLDATIKGYFGLLKLIPDTKHFVNAPLYHAGPYAWTMVSAALGAQVVMRRKFDPAESLDLMAKHEIEQAYYVPTHFVRFLRLPDDVKSSFDPKHLKGVHHTGAPCPPEVKKQMIDWWGPVIVEYYGASEGAGSGCIVDSEEWLAKPGTVGKPLPTCEVWILDEKGNKLGPNETGQIYFKNLLGGDFEYHNAPEKTADAHLEPGVYTYGDVGYIDEDGYVFLSDRKIDMIVSGGVNIYPAEIEAVLITHEKVADVAVFGVPNDEFGEEVKAALQLVPGEQASDELGAEIKGWAKERMAGYKVPRSIDFHEDFPRTATGKLQKRLLRDPYWEGRERAI